MFIKCESNPAFGLVCKAVNLNNFDGVRVIQNTSTGRWEVEAFRENSQPVVIAAFGDRIAATAYFENLLRGW